MNVPLGLILDGSQAVYPFPTPVTLFDGRVVDDPGNTPATAEDCLPYQCGADGDNMAAKMWCGYWSLARTIPGCVYPECEPFRSRIPGCSLPGASPQPPLLAPSLPQSSTFLTPPPIPTLTPQNIVAPLPDITRTLAPELATVPSSRPWCVLNEWIGDNPLLALAMLAGATILLLPKGVR